MATLVCFHAHPDDESITTGGAIAKAKAAGHRVVLVVATRGEHGEIVEGVLEPGEALGVHRITEAMASAAALGVDRVEFLGYVDSGMMGTPENDAPYAFWQADVDRAARRLAAILLEEAADVVTVYDDNGNYGHPDHIQVHRVGIRACELAGIERVFEATMNRDNLRALIAASRDQFSEAERAEMPDLDDPDQAFGVPEARITHCIDVSEFTGLKRASMRAHPSQIAKDNFFLTMPDDMFNVSFGTEWYIAHGRPRSAGAPFGDDLFGDDLFGDDPAGRSVPS